MLTSRDDRFHQFVPSQRIPVIKEVAARCNNYILLFLCPTDLGLCFFDFCIQCFHRYGKPAEHLYNTYIQVLSSHSLPS